MRICELEISNEYVDSKLTELEKRIKKLEPKKEKKSAKVSK